MKTPGFHAPDSKSKAAHLLHPVRLRILMTLTGREMTPQQIGECLPDVPRASLYRHIQTLYAADVIRVVKETPVRGTLEKVYAVEEQNATLTAQELANETPKANLRYFTAYVASLLAQFRNFAEHHPAQLTPGEFGYSTFPVYLTDEEAGEMANELNVVFRKWLAQTPEEGRRRRLLSMIVMPSEDIAKDEG